MVSGKTVHHEIKNDSGKLEMTRAGGHVASAIRKQRVMDASVDLVLPILIHPAYGMMLPIFGLSLHFC